MSQKKNDSSMGKKSGVKKSGEIVGKKRKDINVKKPSKKRQKQIPQAGPTVIDSQEPGTSGVNKQHDSQDSDFEDDGEVCCVCQKFRPPILMQSLILFNWAQCDVCGHWVHLQYCSPVNNVGQNDKFSCPHCA